MAGDRFNGFNQAVQSANMWLSDVAAALGTDDHRFAYRALRAWLHGLRDRLTVREAAKFGAQLPELLRGVYYDGWEPGRAPVKYGPRDYRARFAREARMSDKDVSSVAAAVGAAIGNRLSPGQLPQAFAQLPTPLRAVMAGQQDAVREASGQGKPLPGGEFEETPVLVGRIAELESQVDTLSEALRVLVQGLEDTRLGGTDEAYRSRSARLAAEILVGGQ